MLKQLQQYLGIARQPRKILQDVVEGYDNWSDQYDDQPDNLMLKLDNALLYEFLPKLKLAGKQVLDIGCGTGRHWEKLYNEHPASLSGVDVSGSMLGLLSVKYPAAQVFKATEESLAFPNRSFDKIISTLTIAHIANASHALKEWARILIPGGDLYLTDFHPILLKNGGERSFKKNGTVYSVMNHVHPVKEIISLLTECDLKPVERKEIFIDEDLRYFYEQQNALHIYNRFKGLPVIYALHLRKAYATE